MKKIISLMIVANICFFLSSCGSSSKMDNRIWTCYIDAIGEQPSNKTYYVEGRFPQDINPLVVKEYLKDLEITLSHLGYSRVDSTDAALKLAFGYVLGDVAERAYVSSSPVYQYIPPTSTTTNSTIKNKYGQTLGKVSSTSNNNNGSYAYSGERTHTTYDTKQPINIMLDAFDTKTKEAVWSVRVDDTTNPGNIQNLRKIMPLYLLNMYSYIGGDSQGRRYTYVNFNDHRLQWYNPQSQQPQHQP